MTGSRAIVRLNVAITFYTIGNEPYTEECLMDVRLHTLADATWLSKYKYHECEEALAESLKDGAVHDFDVRYLVVKVLGSRVIPAPSMVTRAFAVEYAVDREPVYVRFSLELYRFADDSAEHVEHEDVNIKFRNEYEYLYARDDLLTAGYRVLEKFAAPSRYVDYAECEGVLYDESEASPYIVFEPN